jgi:hypothetical protein
MITWNIDPTNYTHEQINELALVVADMDTSIATQLYDSMKKQNKFWYCTECDSSEYTGSISDSDIQYLQCSRCGCNEFIYK